MPKERPYTPGEKVLLKQYEAEEKALKISKEIDALKNSTLKSMEDALEAAKEMGILEKKTSGNMLEQKILTAARTKLQESDLDGAKELLKNKQKMIKKEKEFGRAVNEIFPGVTGIMEGVERSAKGMAGILGPASMAVAIFIVLAKLALDYGKAIADTRKELGVSVKTAMKLNAQNRILGMQAKLYGLDIEDIKTAQAAIRQDLGASVQEAANLSLSFARTSSATGQTAEQLTKTLSIMESISTASRETLLNQIRSNAAMIEAAGVAPALVMRDIADNAEFFASFAKDGGKNLIMAATAARKLGLDMSVVASATDSLLDFESSIEASMEASMLLGRQINTDKARMLALSGDQEGLMKEIQRIAGSEQDFNQMNVLQRRALAKSVGQSVEGLARIVRNNQAGATGAAAGGAMGSVAEKQLSTQNQQLEVSRQIADNTRKQANF
jgi:hypothetical protein